MDLARPPLVSPEVDLRDFAFMPLEFRRLFTSETWLLGREIEKVAALALWCESWHQVPAASLPDNDRVLALLSQAGGRWPKVKTHALRGWVKCSDGRLYHPVVAGKALEAWERKLEQRRRTSKARIAMLEKRVAAAETDGDRRELQAQLHRLQQELLQTPVTASKGQGQGQGEGQGQGKEKAGQKHSAAPRRSAVKPATNETWVAYANAYERRYGAKPVRNAKQNGMLAKLLERLGTSEAPHVAAFYVEDSRPLYVNAGHCVELLLRDAEVLRTSWATGKRIGIAGRASERQLVDGRVNYEDGIPLARVA